MTAAAVAGSNLRFATRGDAGLILAVVGELAEYAKLGHDVAADEAALAEHLFGRQPRAEVVIADVDGQRRGHSSKARR